VQECDPAEAHKYGIVAKGADVHTGFEITGMVEKPAKGTAPSNLFLNGRYILQPDIFAILEHQERGAGNEIQLTDGMLKLQNEQQFYGYHYKGRTFDCGSPEGFIEANIAFALWNPGMRGRIAAHIDELFAEMHPEERRKRAGASR
jgi:UTP--glucose-1-phosphate uridylyltransferase